MYKEIDALKKQVKFLETIDITNKYKKSDCFIATGLSQKDAVQRTLVQKYAYTVFDLEFPIKLGSVDTQDIIMISSHSDGLFQVSFTTTKINNNCQLDFNYEERVLCITLGGKHDRFFIFDKKETKTSVTKGQGYITIGLGEPLVNNLCVASMVNYITNNNTNESGART
jgi:hypothetical protein